jgi:hypothetical protein
MGRLRNFFKSMKNRILCRKKRLDKNSTTEQNNETIFLKTSSEAIAGICESIDIYLAKRSFGAKLLEICEEKETIDKTRTTSESTQLVTNNHKSLISSTQLCAYYNSRHFLLSIETKIGYYSSFHFFGSVRCLTICSSSFVNRVQRLENISNIRFLMEFRNELIIRSNIETQLSEREEIIKSFREEILRMCSVLKQNQREKKEKKIEKKIEESKGFFFNSKGEKLDLNERKRRKKEIVCRQTFTTIQMNEKSFIRTKFTERSLFSIERLNKKYIKCNRKQTKYRIENKIKRKQRIKNFKSKAQKQYSYKGIDLILHKIKERREKQFN